MLQLLSFWLVCNWIKQKSLKGLYLYNIKFEITLKMKHFTHVKRVFQYIIPRYLKQRFQNLWLIVNFSKCNILLQFVIVGIVQLPEFSIG